MEGGAGLGVPCYVSEGHGEVGGVVDTVEHKDFESPSFRERGGGGGGRRHCGVYRFLRCGQGTMPYVILELEGAGD